MSRKNKLNAEEKVRIAEDCIEGRISQAEAARRVGVDESSIRAWIAKYKSEGSYGLWQTEKNRVYSEELKLQAVTEYLAGSGSLREICNKHKIRSKKQLRDWIKMYNSGRDFKNGSGLQKNVLRMGTTTERLPLSTRSATRTCIPGSRSTGNWARPGWRIAAASVQRSRSLGLRKRGCGSRTLS